jgi:hypothetical protein
LPRRKGTPRTFNSRPLRPGEALDALTCTPLRLGMSACDSRHCTTATNRRGGPRKAQERPSPPSPLPHAERLKPASGLQHRSRKPAPSCCYLRWTVVNISLARLVWSRSIQAESGSVSSFRRLMCRKGKRRISTRLASARCSEAQTRSRIGRRPGGASNWVERRRP